MIAKMASDCAKPRGLMEVRAGWEKGFLAGLPLSALPGVGPKTAERWAVLGLVDVHQIQEMAERALEQLIGADARSLKLRANGRGGTVLRPDRLPKSVSRETTLSRDLRDPEELERILALLTARVAAQLRDEQILARVGNPQAPARRLSNGDPPADPGNRNRSGCGDLPRCQGAVSLGLCGCAASGTVEFG